MESGPDPSAGLGALIGIEWQEVGPERARARIAVTPEVCQPFGIVHGGSIAALAESVCSAATWDAVRHERMIAVGQSNQASFLRPISQGHVNCEATPRHRGSTTWVWDCDLTDDDGRLCAIVRMTIAVRPMPSA
jgi:uncharacterized protein (TIGR00369 family)